MSVKVFRRDEKYIASLERMTLILALSHNLSTREWEKIAGKNRRQKTAVVIDGNNQRSFSLMF